MRLLHTTIFAWILLTGVAVAAEVQHHRDREHLTKRQALHFEVPPGVQPLNNPRAKHCRHQTPYVRPL